MGIDTGMTAAVATKPLATTLNNTDLDDDGAGDGNRTRVISLEGWGSTIELLPPGTSGRASAFRSPYVNNNTLKTSIRLVEEAGFEPA
jgi:hypothetical protein